MNIREFLHTKFVAPAVPTLFQSDGTPDIGAIERMASFLQARGIPAATVAAGMGSGFDLSPDESIAVLSAWRRKFFGRIFVGALSAGVEQTRQLLGRIKSSGCADVALVFSDPRRTRMNDARDVAYFQRLADCGMPLILYQFPANGSVITPSVISSLRGTETIVGVKCTSESDELWNQTRAAAGEQIAVINGWTPLTLKRRASVIDGGSCFLFQQQLALIRHFRDGSGENLESAQELMTQWCSLPSRFNSSPMLVELNTAVAAKMFGGTATMRFPNQQVESEVEKAVPGIISEFNLR